MKFTNMLLSAVVASSTLLSLGCQQNLDAIVTAYPATAPLLGGRAKPSPFTLKVGNVQGFVFGASGKSQPIPLAFVSTGSVSAFAGNPDPLKVIELDKEFEDSANDTKRIFVQHNYNDGKGVVATERILRKNPPKPGPDELDIEDDTDRELAITRLKYVYLRPGEFFLEGVPEGIANLQASFGNVSSSSNPITVYSGNTVTDVSMNLFIPEPVTVEDKRVPRVVEWTGLKPETGISVNAQTKITNSEGVRTVETTISYKPDPPDVAVTLKAPPGSAGAVIKAVDVIYVYNTPLRQRSSLAPIQIGPIRIPISPVVVSPAQDIAFGPPSVIVVPVGSSTLRTIFGSPEPDEQPGLIVANMEFIDENGFAIQDKVFQNLQVSAVLRSL